MILNTAKEAELFLKQSGFKEIVIPFGEEEHGRFESYVLAISNYENVKYICLLPINLNEYKSTEDDGQKRFETPEETASRVLFNDTGLTTSVSSFVHTGIIQETKDTKYVKGVIQKTKNIFCVKEFYGNINEFPSISNKNKGQPFWFPLDKFGKIIDESQLDIILELHKNKNLLD